ncbi:4064_t:CDS:2, partial [Racocetra persica]
SETYKDHMNHGISYYSKAYIDFTLSSNMWIIDNFLITRYIKKDVPEDEYEDGPDILSIIGNAKGSMFESDDFEKESNFLPTIKNIEDNIYEGSDLEEEPEEYKYSNSDDKLEDSSLKEINAAQTFTSFEMLEQYLKYYSTQMVSTWGKCLPKKNLDPITNKEQESACIECDFLLNTAYRKWLNLVFVNKFVEKHNDTLKDSELLQNKFSDQKIYNRDLYNMISRFKTDNQTKNDALALYKSLVRLQQKNPNWYFKVDFEGIELRLKDKAQYARLQEFKNMNSTTGLPYVSNIIFKNIDKMCKKYLTPNSLAL